MTEFKHGSNNYHKKLSTADKAVISGGNVTACDENSHKPRLKKSFSECEYYEMESGMSGSYNLSPARRKCRLDESHRFHHCPRQTTMNDGVGNNVTMGDISFIDIQKASVPYNYDTSKSQYLLAQQQKLKEYKNDPNYLATAATIINGDNYSSESSTETRGILKNKNITTAAATTTVASSSTTTSESNASNNTNNNSNKSLLKRNKGLSTLSLCSCDADTEVSLLYSIV